MNGTAHFDQLPNDATVPIKVFAVVASEGVSTLWGKAKRHADFPQPIRRGAKCTRFNVGQIRAYLSGKDAALNSVASTARSVK